jgi:6-phosphogluconolactonase (cycloisomerase 2 family)
VTSYTITPDGSLTVIDQQSTHPGTTCWIAASPNGRYQYVTNTATDTISGLRVAPDGALALLDADGVTAAPGTGALPIDMALSGGGRFLYSLTPGLGMLSSYRVHPDGSQTALEPV